MWQVGLQFPQFRIDRLLAHLQQVANRESLDLQVDHPASQACAPVPGTSGAVASTSVSPSKRPSDSPHGPSPAKRSKRDAPPRSPTPSDVQASDNEVTPPQAVSATISPAPAPCQQQQQQQRQQQQYPRYPLRSTRGRVPDRYVEPEFADWRVSGTATRRVDGLMPDNQPLSHLMQTTYPGIRVKTCDRCDCELSTSSPRPALHAVRQLPCPLYTYPRYFRLLVLLKII